MQASIACLLLLSMVLTANAMSLGMNRVMYGLQGQRPSMNPIGSTQDTGTYARTYTHESQDRQPGPLSSFGPTEGSYGQRFNLGLYEHQGTTNGSPGQEGLSGGKQGPFTGKGFGILPQFGPLDQGLTSQGYQENGGYQNKVSGNLPQYSPSSQRLTSERHQGYGGGLHSGMLDKPSGHLSPYVTSNKGLLSTWGNGGYKDPLSGHSQDSPLSQGLTAGAYQGYVAYQDKLSGHQYGPPRQSLTSGGYQDKLLGHSTQYGPLGYGSGLYGGFQDRPLGNFPQYVPSNQYLTSGGSLGYRAGYQDKPTEYRLYYVPSSQGLTSGGYQGYRGGYQDKPSGYLLYYVPSSQGLTEGNQGYRGGYQDKPSGYQLYYVPLSQGLTSGGYQGYRGGYQDKPSYLSQYVPVSQGLTSGGYQGYRGGYQGIPSGYQPQYGSLHHGMSSVGDTGFGGFQDSRLRHLGHSSSSGQGLRSGDDWGGTGGLQGGIDQERYFKQYGPLHQRPTSEQDLRDGRFQAKQSGNLSESSPVSQGLTTLGYQGIGGFQDKLSGHQQLSAPVHQGSISRGSHGGYPGTFLGRANHQGPSDKNKMPEGARGNISGGLQGGFQDKSSGNLEPITTSQGVTTESGGLQRNDSSDEQMGSGVSLGNVSQGMPSGYLQDPDSSGKRNEDHGPETEDNEPAL